MATIAVIGLGSIGSIFAAHLVAAGSQEVVCCVRTPVEQIVIDSAYGTIEATPVCLTDPAVARPVDWVLLATKTQDTPGAAAWFASLCDFRTRIVVLQNGVDQENRTKPYCAAEILSTVVFANGKKLAPHHIRHLCPDQDLIVPDTDTGREFASIFKGSHLVVKASSDFLTVSWQKFLANIVANPLTAITERGIEVVRKGDMEQLALGLLREAVMVGRASGVTLADDAAEQTLRWMSRYPGETGTSMLQDRLDGRPLEFEALTGTVVRLGELHSLPTPLNRAILALLGAIGTNS